VRALTLVVCLLTSPAWALNERWRAWPASSGPVAYVALPDAPARRVVLRCAVGREGFVDLTIADAWFFPRVRPAALVGGPFAISQLRLAVDGGRARTLNARYDRASRRYTTTLAVDDPLLERLMAGHRLTLDEPLAPGAVALGLAGTRAAISRVLARCP
jgi:hypothetical protein